MTARKRAGARKGAGAPKGRPKRAKVSLGVAPAVAAVTPGIDVSHFQNTIGWSKVAGAGLAFAFIKATEGATSADKEFPNNWVGARAAGVIRGAYHFLRPGSTPADQAAAFYAQVGPLAKDDLPPAVDLEAKTGWPSSTSARTQLVLECLSEVERLFKRRVVVYTSRTWVNDVLGGSTALSPYPLWVADYSQSPPRLPPGFADWVFWQHSETGSVSGVPTAVDLDRFQGGAFELDLFIRQSILP